MRDIVRAVRRCRASIQHGAIAKKILVCSLDVGARKIVPPPKSGTSNGSTPCNIASLSSLYGVLHTANDLRAHRGIVARLNAVGVLENAM